MEETSISEVVDELWSVNVNPQDHKWIKDIWTIDEEEKCNASIVVDTELGCLSHEKIQKMMEIANKYGFEVIITYVKCIRIVLDKISIKN